jgi:catechol 2,3-dioxygenase-like lactoylglutathione lyase family enzyme
VEETISELLDTYEEGAVTRRQVIAALALLVGAGTKLSAAPLSGGTLDHLGLQVSDLARSTRFYRDVLGGTLPPGVRPDGSVRLDFAKGGFLTLRELSPGGRVDHFCVKLEKFNKEAVAQQLKAQGIIPIDEPNFTGTGAGFHVVDPDGLNVQLS